MQGKSDWQLISVFCIWLYVQAPVWEFFTVWNKKGGKQKKIVDQFVCI